MRLLFVLLLTQTVNLVFGQWISNVNFDAVKSEIRDSSSANFYPLLLEKARNLDTTLSDNQYHLLYYGSVFQSTYHPYGTSNLKKEFLDFFAEGKYAEAIDVGYDALDENPVDPEVLVKMSISCLETGNDDLKRIFAIHYFSYLDVIYASGNGLDVSTAYVVISVDHEYLIAADLGLRVVQQALISDCDLLTFSKKGQKKLKGRKKIKYLYFNVRMPLMSLSSSFKDADLPDPDDE